MPKDLPVIAVPSTQKVMYPTPVAAKLAKMAASTGSLSAAQTGTTSLLGQSGTSSNLIVNKQVPGPQGAGMKNSVQTTSLATMASTVPSTKTDLIATMTNQIQSSQLLLQNQTLVPLVGSQLVLSQPQGLLLVGNNPAPGQQHILLTQPQGLVPVTNKTAGNHMTSLLGNRTIPVSETTRKSEKVSVDSTDSNLTLSKEVDQKNKFLKFVNLPATTPSKIATVAPMRAETKVEGVKAVTESKEIEVKKENNEDFPKESNISNDTSENKIEGSIDNTNVRKRPLFRARKSLNTQGETCSKIVAKQEQFSDSDGDFKSEKAVKKETKVEKAGTTQSKSNLHESKSERTESKSQKMEKKDVHKLQSEMQTSVGKSFNAAGMTTRRNKSRTSLPLEASSETGKTGMAVDNHEADAKPTGSEVNRSVRGETKKSIADKLKQFRRESVDEAGVLTEIKQEIQEIDSDFIEKVKSPIGSPEDQLNTRRRRSGKKRKSSPSKLKNKRSKGVDFEDVVDDSKENQVITTAFFQLSINIEYYICSQNFIILDKLVCLNQ